tara:strand:+ start:52 stop:369 length:318 start_codon:yes stop_codon:yes gene_type:complete
MNSNIYDKHSKTNLLSIISNMKKKDISNMMDIYNDQYTNIIDKAIEKNKSNIDKSNINNSNSIYKNKDISYKPNITEEPITITKSNLLNRNLKKTKMNNNIYKNI